MLQPIRQNFQLKYRQLTGGSRQNISVWPKTVNTPVTSMRERNEFYEVLWKVSSANRIATMDLRDSKRITRDWKVHRSYLIHSGSLYIPNNSNSIIHKAWAGEEGAHLMRNKTSIGRRRFRRGRCSLPQVRKSPLDVRWATHIVSQ